MPRPLSFWRNVVLIGAVHVAILVGLTRWGGAAKKPLATDIVWMESGLVETAAPLALPQPTPELAAPPVIPAEEESQVPEPDEAPPLPTAVENEAPAPTATPRPSPAATPKATPKPTPKKALLAKSSPKPSATPAKKKLAQTKKDAGSTPPKKAAATASSATGPAGANAGANASQFSWYGNMLHDRFFSEWVQPKSAVMSGTRMSALVRLRIEKDGRISDFAIVRSSGNVVVDESVAAVAKRVTQVDPLPSGLGSGGSYTVNINFELNPE